MTDTVTVKPLVWSSAGTWGNQPAYYADSAMGWVQIVDHRQHGNGFRVYPAWEESDEGNYEDLEAAKAAAQNDYERRIRAALEPQTPAQAARKPTRDDGTPDVGPPVFVMYTNYLGETARREISPVGIWFGSTDWHPKNGWLLHCYDWGKKDWRDYELLSCDFRAIAGGE